jgi:hypothetical protein
MDERYITSIVETQAEESLNLEYKEGFVWASKHTDISWLQAKTIRAILGFSNTEGGGLILIGVKDDGNGNREFAGLTPEQQSSYGNLESVQDCIDRYADGALSYTVKIVKVTIEENEQTYVAISVNDFKTMPVLAKNDIIIVKSSGGKDYILKKDDLYVRSRSGRYATIKATSLELREVISLAHGKDEERLLRLLNSVAGKTTPKLPEVSPYEELDKDL